MRFFASLTSTTSILLVREFSGEGEVEGDGLVGEVFLLTEPVDKAEEQVDKPEDVEVCC